MAPAAKSRQPSIGNLLGIAVVCVGLLLTLSQFAWLIVFGETVWRHLPFEPASARWIPALAGVILIGWLLYRYRAVVRRQTEPGRRLVLPLVHAGTVLVAAALLTLYPPAQLEWNGWPATVQPSGGSFLDAMALWIAVSIVLVFVAVPGLTGAYLVTLRNGAPSVSLVAAGLLLAVSVLLMHSLTALVRMLVDNLLGYVTGLFGAVPRGYSSAVLLSYDNPADAGDSRLDLFPFLALIAVVGAVAPAVVVLASQREPGLPPLMKDKAARGRWWHDVSAAAPRLLPVIVPLAVLLGFAGMSAAILLGEGRLGGPWLALAVLFLQLAGAAVVLVILLGQLRPVREVLGKIADIAGFWPVRDHPLAGSSYRQAATAGVEELVERAHGLNSEVVLVAHSQGSVICAWSAAHRTLDRAVEGRTHLVTAGSPLSSLYAVFFPSAFPPEFFSKVNHETLSWANYWRETDPVAFPVPGAANHLLIDPRADGRVRSHSDYWVEPAIIEHVGTLARHTE